MIHTVTIGKSLAEAIYDGRCSFFIIDNNKHGFNAGDFVKFKVLDEINTVMPQHILSKQTYVISYVLSGQGLKYNYVCCSIKLS